MKHWKKQQYHKDYEMIACKPFDPIKDFDQDPTGYYLLVRVNFETYCIEVAVVNQNNEIEKAFSGRTAQDVYLGILAYEKANNLKWFQEKSHLAYLGKEMKKAEVALAMGNNGYFQE